MNYNRNHWLVENKLHWSLDVILKEDDSRTAKHTTNTLEKIKRNELSVSVKRQPTARSSIFGFFPTHKPTLKNQKSLPLPTHDKIVDIYTIRQCDFTIFELLKIHSTPMYRIKEVLKEKGITQTCLAKQLDKTYNTINEYARNVRQPSIEDLCRIAKILHLNAKYLLKEE